ncbi:MAG: hypothetical protein HY816_04350 [Candidatus Wallbacteria bacterium]|nr:hypothetical protein [Candidatus Wallbacteria bacterium]
MQLVCSSSWPGLWLDDLIEHPWQARAASGDWTELLTTVLRHDLEAEPGASFPTAFVWHLTWVWRLGLQVDSLHVRVALPPLRGWPSIALALLEARLGAPETAATAARKCRQDPDPEVREAARVVLALLGRPPARPRRAGCRLKRSTSCWLPGVD